MTSAQVVLLVGGVLVAFVVGSFTNVIIDRLPYRLDEPDRFGDTVGTRPWSEVLGGRSRCSSCATPVRPIDNIPVVSWLVLRGKCRSCGERIPPFHLLVELLVPALVVLAVWSVGFEPNLALVLWLIPVGTAVAMIDHEWMFVPTRIVWPAFFVSVPLGVAMVLVDGRLDTLWGGAVGILTICGPLFVIWFLLPSHMGFGDVRLTTLLGWHVGLAATLADGSIRATVFLGVATIAIAAVCGLLYSIGGFVLKRRVPFGPTLVVGSLVTSMLARHIVEPF